MRQLLCLLTRDNPRSTEDLRTLLMDRIALTLRGHVASSDLAFAVRHEMALLAALVQKEDSCWEQKLRYKQKFGRNLLIHTFVCETNFHTDIFVHVHTHSNHILARNRYHSCDISL